MHLPNSHGVEHGLGGVLDVVRHLLDQPFGLGTSPLDPLINVGLSKLIMNQFYFKTTVLF